MKHWLAILGLTFMITSPRFGFEPYNLEIRIDATHDTRGEVCIAVYEGEYAIDGDAYLTSCFQAENQQYPYQRSYRNVYFGTYVVIVSLDDKHVESPQRFTVLCTETGNKSNQPRCPEVEN